MFHPEPSLTWVPATREQVVAIIESINQPQVSIAGKPPQTVTGHLCALRNTNGTFSIYVALHVPRSGQSVVYVHDKRQVSLEEYRDIEIEGLQFLESMGFMLDNLNFRNLTPDMQEMTVKRIPLFGGRPEPTAAPASASPGPGRTALGMPAVGGSSGGAAPAAGQTGMGLQAVGATFPSVSSTSLGMPAVAPPAPQPTAAPSLSPRESAALARLLASF